jgi:tetratricopeptide (TPR) repeat protein
LHHFTTVFSSSEASEQEKVEGWLRYGRLCLRKGNIQEAQNAYTESYEYCVQHSYWKGQVQSLHALGHLDKFGGDLQEAENKYTQALQLSKTHSNTYRIAKSLAHLGTVLWTKGDFYGASTQYRESLSVVEETGNGRTIASFLEYVWLGFQGIDNLEEALQTYEKGVRILEQLGDKMGVAKLLNRIGEMFYAHQCHTLDQLAPPSDDLHFRETIQETQKWLDHALKKHQESLQISCKIGDKLEMARALEDMGILSLYTESHNSKHALQHLKKGLVIFEKVGDTIGVATTLSDIGFVYFFIGKWEQALKYYKKSLKIQHVLGNLKELIRLHISFGKLYYFTKNSLLTFKHLFTAQAMSNKTGIYYKRTPRLICSYRDRLNPKQFINIAHKAVEQLPEDLKSYINVEEFFSEEMKEETTIRYETPKIGRNDPCPCGSGKKYKKCCGR